MTQLRISVRSVGILLLSSIAVLCILFVWIFPISRPPSERKLIENFYTHRAAYERSRDMLLEDKQLLRVARWGVQTNIGINKPPAGNFPLDRYNEYVELLQEVGGIAAFRESEDAPASVGIVVYASGWAGDTRHVDICWVPHEPANQVMSLDRFYQTPKPRTPVYKHIDGNWYLWAD